MLTDMACNKLLEEYENGIKVFENASSTLQAQKRRLNQMLRDYVPTQDFVIPEISPPGEADYADLWALIEACTYFKEHPLYNTSEGLINSCINALNNAINGIYGAGVEFFLTFLLEDFEFGINGFDLANLVPNLDKIIECLSHVCGQDVQDKIDRVDGLVSGIGLNDDGTLNKDDLYNEIPGVDAKAQFQNCVETVDANKKEISASMGLPSYV